MEYSIQESILVNKSISNIEKKIDQLIREINGKITEKHSDCIFWISKYSFQTIRCKAQLIPQEKNTEIIIMIDSDYIGLPGSKKILSDFKIALINDNIECLKNTSKDSQTPTKQNTEVTQVKPVPKNKKTLNNFKKDTMTLEEHIKSNFAIIGIIVILLLFLAFKNINFIPKQKVENSSWDSTVIQVELYILHHINDRDSYHALEWGKVIKINEDEYRVRHKYRFQNDYGDIVVENQIFSLDKEGNVINVWSPN